MTSSKKTPTIYHLVRAIPPDALPHMSTIDEALQTLVRSLEDGREINEKLEIAETIVQTLEGLDVVSNAQISDCIPSLSKAIISVVESYNGDEDTKSNLLAAGRIATELHELRCEISNIATLWLQNALWSFHDRGTRVADALELSTSLEGYLDVVKDSCRSDRLELIHAEPDIEKLVERTLAYLQLLQYVLLHMEKNTLAEVDFLKEMVRNNVLETLAVFSALGQQVISKVAADLLGKVLPVADAKVDVSKLVRDLVYHLIQNGHFEVAISLWLRWVDMPSSIGPSSHLPEVAYWTSIQTALTSGTPAIRKMLLYIIGKSLRLIDHSFSTGIFSWDASRSKELLAAWDRYATLTDMIGIQCSPNQFGDALPEFSKLLDGGSKTIHGSWIGILFSMAFRSTSGGLQRHAYNFIFSLPEEKQYFFEEAEGFLCGEFLSFMLGSQHLQQEIGKDDTCQHGANLAKFLEGFISRTQNRQYVAEILDLIHERGDHMFVPTRLYLLDGISRGVSSSKTRILNLEDMRKIVRNTGYRQIAKMRKHIVLLLYLDLLSGISLESTSTEEKLEFLNAIAWIIQDSDSRRIFTLEIAIKLLKKIHPEKKPWLKSLLKNRKLKEQEFDEPKQVLLKALLTGPNADSSLMSYFAYLLFGPKMIRMATSQNVLGLPEESLSRFRTNLLIKVFGESEAAPASISLVRGGNKSSEAQRDFDELLDTFTYSQFRTLPVRDMQVLAKLEARGNGFRQIVKDMDGVPLKDVLFPLYEVQSLVEENRDRALEIVKRTSAILELRGNMLESGLTKATEDEPALLELLERIEIPRSQSNDAINAENFGVYSALLTSIYTNLHLQIQAHWRTLHHNRRFRQHSVVLPELLSRFINCIRRHQRFLEGPAILPVLNFIGLFVEKIKIPDEHYEDYDDGELHMNYEWIEDCGLGEYLKECWDSLEQFRGRVEQGVVIKKLIEIIFSTSMIEASYIPSIQTLTKEVADGILRLSIGRLGLLATFSKQLHKVATLSPLRVSRYFHDREDLADVVFQIIGFDFNYSPDPLLERPLASDILQHRLATPDIDSAEIFENYYDHKDVKAFVYIFDLISQLDVTDPSERRFAKWIRERILKLWTEKNRKGMFVHIKQRKTRHLQALLMLERLVDERDKVYVDTIMQCLAEEGHPRFRFMFEWILSLAIGRDNGFALKIQQALAQEDKAKKANPKYQTSLLAIAVKSASLINIDHRAEYYEQLITTIMSYAIHSKVVIRHQAITGVLQICNEISALLAIYSALNNVGAVTHGSERIMIQKELFARAQKLHHLRYNPLLEALYQSIKSSQYYKENTRTMEDQITFNPQEECTMSGIFEGEYLEGGDYVEVIPVELWDTLPPTMEGRSRFVDIGTETDYNNDFDSEDEEDSEEESHPHDTAPKVESKSTERRQIIPFTKSEAAALDPHAIPSIAGPLQTKSRSDPTATISPPTPTLPTPSTSDSDPILILVASHVTSPPNLGGICRLSEIFGVRILYLADPSIVTSKDFASVSVSSEVWLPIQGLSADAATQREFYKRMRREGFTIVGVEQTDGSVVLGKEGWAFPRRCVLVLGSEKEGMPPEVLAEMDVCVEIRQRGETRSLNVQVAAGVVVAEFNRQWGL